MTATIDFYVEQKNNVLMVPNAALRFQPPEDLLSEYQNENARGADSSRGNIPDSIRNRFRGMNFGNFNPNNMPGFNPNNMPGRGFSNFMRNSGRLWYLDNNGKLQMTMAFLGLTDGKNTEIVRSRNLKAGMKVITGMENNSNENNSNVQNQNFPRGFGRF